MKSCDEYKQLINSYIDMELTRAQRLEVEEHLEECANCRAYYGQLKRLFGMEYLPMPHSVAGSVMDKIITEIEEGEDPFSGPEKLKKAARKKQWSKDFKTWGAIAAVCVLALTTSIFGYLFDTDKDASEQAEVASSQADYSTAQDNEVKAESEKDMTAAGESGLNDGGREKAYSAVLVSAVRHADGLVVKFAADRLVITDKALIEQFAVYLEGLPCAVSHAASQVRIGSIATTPDCGLDVAITENHTIVFDDGVDMIEIMAGRDSLLDMLDRLGA